MMDYKWLPVPAPVFIGAAVSHSFRNGRCPCQRSLSLPLQLSLMRRDPSKGKWDSDC